MKRIGVLVSGNGSNLQAMIDASEAGELSAEVAVVVSNKPGAFALERARKRSIECVVAEKTAKASREEYDAGLAETLKSRGVDLVVLAGFMRIVTRPLIEAFPWAIVNIHPSLLPSFPGLDAQRQALESGVRITGCTVHFVDEGLDSGPIIMQAAVPVLSGDSVETLSKRILAEEHRIYPQAVRFICDGRVGVTGRRVAISSAGEPDFAVENPAVDIGLGRKRQ